MTSSGDQIVFAADAVERMGAQLASAIAPSQPPATPTEIPEHIVWPFEEAKGGTAWVFLAEGHQKVTNPVIMSDGFKGEPSKVEDWHVLWHDDPDDPRYAWGKDLHAAGKDVIILGYNDRTDSIIENAKIARACINRVIDERDGDTPLVVGGFSMGGLITRYTLALMETEGDKHETSTYFSYDSPHRGGWVPISVQAFAHFMASQDPNNPALTAMSRMLNSPASKQMSLYHIATHDGDPQAAAPHEMRDDFLDELKRVGWFPKDVQKSIGVANGPAGGEVRALPTDNKTLECDTLPLDVFLYGQAPAQAHLVADLSTTTYPFLRPPVTVRHEVHTSDIAALDGAPGGTLETNGLAVTALKTVFPDAPKTDFPWVCFVPTVSAVDVGDPTNAATAPIPDEPPEGCGLDAYKCATASEDPKHYEHTLLTEELCTWLLHELV
jgi:hypothetical protein